MTLYSHAVGSPHDLDWNWIVVLLFAGALAKDDLSLVFPATSLVYVVSPLDAKFILKGTATLQRWVEIVFVCLGVS